MLTIDDILIRNLKVCFIVRREIQMKQVRQNNIRGYLVKSKVSYTMLLSMIALAMSGQK